MPRIFTDPDTAFEPDPVDVAATATAEGVGLDTAATLTRRQVIEDQAAALRTSAVVDATVCDLLDAIIAAVFDA